MADSHRAFRANICLVPIGRNCFGDWKPRTIYQRDTDNVTLHFIARFHLFIILPIYFLFHCQISFIHHSAYLLCISLPDFIHSSFCLSTLHFIARFHSFIILPIYFSFHCQISFFLSFCLSTFYLIARFHSLIILPIYFSFYCQISLTHHSAYLLFISLPDFIHSSFCLSTFYFIARFHSLIILPSYFSFHSQISFTHHSAYLSID